MKQVYKCDYCRFMGSKKEVEEHERECVNNYDRRSCYTCEHSSLKSRTQFSCDCGVELEENHIKEFCKQYNRRVYDFLKNGF